MATPETRRKTVGVDLRILFDNVESGGLFDSVGASRLRLVFEIGFSSREASEPALDSPDDSGALAQSAADVPGCCRCSNAVTPLIKDDSSNLLLRNSHRD
ncbi:hypothetical protein RB195_008546 [Necator americanus]|uniref:Uncharacterized protein n=1 Tax=Necator americanus TaxID=51031 RepID=A0ABR1CP73_NECAM